MFWIWLLALNQHEPAEEMGLTPEEMPFNAALAKAQHGAVMVLDSRAEPMRRLWCLYEVGRASQFKQALWLIVDEGDLANASASTLEEISDRLLELRACKANASRASDELAIHYRILDPAAKSQVGSFEFFKQCAGAMNESMFVEFDAHICSLIGTPILKAGLRAQSEAVCMRAIGMGAEATVTDLKTLTTKPYSADLTAKLETRFGECGLAKE